MILFCRRIRTIDRTVVDGGVKLVGKWRFEIPVVMEVLEQEGTGRVSAPPVGLWPSVFDLIFHAIAGAVDQHVVGMVKESIEDR